MVSGDHQGGACARVVPVLTAVRPAVARVQLRSLSAKQPEMSAYDEERESAKEERRAG